MSSATESPAIRFLKDGGHRHVRRTPIRDGWHGDPPHVLVGDVALSERSCSTYLQCRTWAEQARPGNARDIDHAIQAHAANAIAMGRSAISAVTDWTLFPRQPEVIHAAARHGPRSARACLHREPVITSAARREVLARGPGHRKRSL